jgi:hypothetical protein
MVLCGLQHVWAAQRFLWVTQLLNVIGRAALLCCLLFYLSDYYVLFAAY